MTTSTFNRLAPYLLLAEPGDGATLLARKQRDAIPEAEWLLYADTCADLHKLAGLGCDGRPPFRAPHHTVSTAGMTGRLLKGWKVVPGEIALAYGGVLYLHDLHEFRAESIFAVADALERREVYLSGGGGVVKLPVACQVIASMPPDAFESMSAKIEYRAFFARFARRMLGPQCMVITRPAQK